MKRLAIALGVIVLLLIGGFVWLLGQSSADHAPKNVITVDLEDTYDR